MRALAFLPNVAPPVHSPPQAHGASAAAASPSTFASIMNGFDAHLIEAKPKGHKSEDAAEPQGSIANAGNNSDEKSSSISPPSIEAALVALGYRSSAASADLGFQNPSPEAAGAAPARSTGAGATPRTGAPAPQEAAKAAEKNIGADPTGEASPTAETSPRNLLSSDPTLGLQSVETRTHLALADAAPAAAKFYPAETIKGALPQPANPPFAAMQAASGESGPAQPLSSPQAQNAIASLASAAEASITASPPAPPGPGNKASAALRTQSGARRMPVSSVAPGIASSHATSGPDALGKGDAVSRTSADSPGRSDGETDANGEGASIAASDATFATSNVAVVTGTAAPAAIPINQLADFVTSQAASLSAEIPSVATQQSSATAAPQIVKELVIALDPADLGAVSIKLRLANGKLTVVIGAANPSTRQAIESDRQAIADRLASSQQPLEALVIKAEGQTQTLSGGNNASDPNDPRQSRANGNPASAEREADGRSGRDRASNRTFEDAPSRSRSGDLIV